MVLLMAKQLMDYMFSTYRRQLLAVLLLRPDEHFHVRELARLIDVSPGSLHRELKGMAEAGLLIRSRRGNQVLYQADRSCAIYAELASIFRKTVGLAAILAEALKPINAKIDVAFVFGSMASGKQHAHSDLDICVLSDVEYIDVVKALGEVQEQLNRELNPVVMSTTAYFDKLAHHDRFIERMHTEPKIFVTGDENELGKLAENWAS
jgi:predicted nucleotidyltransferase